MKMRLDISEEGKRAHAFGEVFKEKNRKMKFCLRLLGTLRVVKYLYPFVYSPALGRTEHM